MKLLTFINGKTTKGESHGYLTGILYMTPSNSLYLMTNDEKYKNVNLCPKASKGCREACLFTAGRGVMRPVKQGRINRTKFFIDHQGAFMQLLQIEINQLIAKARRKGLIPVVRLNGTTDIAWENIKMNGKNIYELFPAVQFYDYTKDYNRNFESLPKNYHVTFSRSESNDNKLNKIKNNIAVVFNKLPKEWNGKKVINGDETDLRFLDENNVIVGLTAKGKARYDKSNFVIQTIEV